VAHQPSLGFIGAGKVGTTLARLWYAAGYDVCAVYSRNQETAGALAKLVGANTAISPDDVIEAADLTLLTVSDDAIQTVAASLSHADLNGKGVIHTSGARDAAILAALAGQGAMVGSLHPAFPFASVETAVMGLPGATFAVEAESDVLREWLENLVAAVNGYVLSIPPGRKALYHAALVFASNYTVTLYALAESLLVGLGAERATADLALNALLAGALENLRTQGIPTALTGPLVRGDVGTVVAHIDALHKENGDLATLYRQLARHTLPLLTARNIAINQIEHLINREEPHATDDT
jgi:predicted short-subunit dehydrogenase-like oxidoreductase (DUF2520 family)